ncbi:hypothetical protein BDW69DRAFT_142384 [Aspergillus filifer]
MRYHSVLYSKSSLQSLQIEMFLEKPPHHHSVSAPWHMHETRTKIRNHSDALRSSVEAIIS